MKEKIARIKKITDIYSLKTVMGTRSKANFEKYQQVIDDFSSGKSVVQIALFLNVSRHRIYQIIDSMYRDVIRFERKIQKEKEKYVK